MERRDFISNTLLSIAGMSILNAKSLELVERAFKENSNNLNIYSKEEAFWDTIRSAFNIDKTIINLNNAGVSPSPKEVHSQFKFLLDRSNKLPAYYMWKELEKEKENIRVQIADSFGADSEEIAITRNASEALEIVQQGLDLETGDEVLTTTQDYFRMLNTWDQIERRRGVKIIKCDFPVPLINSNDIVDRIKEKISSRTKVIHVSHVVYLTGQILPIKEISELAHENGIKLICDGAHSFFHFPFKYDDLQSDFFGCSLHKWCYAPIGTGFLHVKKEHIPNVWSLMASPEKMRGNIRKFEEIGTHPAANHNSILLAIEFNRQLGLERKVKRLQILNGIWINRLKSYDRLNILTDISDPNRWGGIVLFNIDSVDSRKLYKYLLNEKNILTAPIIHKQFEGVRVSPNIYNSLEEIEFFADSVENILKGKVNLVDN